MSIAGFYRGIAFPFQKGEQAFPTPVTDDLLVRQSIEQILMTTPTERVMRPAFGCNLQKFVFDNNDDLLPQLLRMEIVGAIGKWEPRAAIQDVEFQRKDSELIVTVSYVVTATGTLNTVNVAVPTQGA
jgi:phage baseplate assembly protein W